MAELWIAKDAIGFQLVGLFDGEPEIDDSGRFRDGSGAGCWRLCTLPVHPRLNPGEKQRARIVLADE